MSCRITRRSLPLASLAWAASSSVLGDEAPKDSVPRLTATRVATAPKVDGRLDEPMWQQAATVGPLTQIRPGNGDAVSEATEVRVAYDKDALYIGARLDDSRGRDGITANIMRQGAGLLADDRIAIILDPAGTGRGAYRFEVNLNSVRNDMLYQNGDLLDDWTVIWQAKAVPTETGWSAEMAIPFKTIPNDPSVEAWGFNVSRALRAKGEEAVWVSRNRGWGPNIAGKLAGIRDVDQGMGLDVVPSIGLRQERDHVSGVKREHFEPSLDAYYRITPSLSASLTLNTDFSATDVDERRVNLTRFSLFFPEKRDFFLKDADLFDFGRIDGNGRPFFSRKIGLSPRGTPVDIEYGGKVSGRIGRVRVGLLSVRQSSFETLDPSTLSVARIAADVLEESSVGFIATSGDPFSNDSSSLVGADFLYLNSRFPGNRTLQGEAWVQKSNHPRAGSDDTAFGVGLELKDEEGWQQEISVQKLGRDFAPALGFVSRPGTVEYAGNIGHNHLVNGPRLQAVFSYLEFTRTETVDGELESQSIVFSPLEFESTARDRLVPYLRQSEEQLTVAFPIHANPVTGARVVIPVGRYKFRDAGLDYFGGEQRRLSARVNLQHGEFFDGDRSSANVRLEWRPSRHLSLNGGYEFNDIDLPDGSFTTRVLSAGYNVNFSSRLSWTSLLQYDNVTEQAGIQSLISYIPEAGRELALVLKHASEDRDRNGSFRSVQAQYAARLAYTLRF